MIKLQSNSSRKFDARRQGSAKIQCITCNRIGPTKLLQSIWLDNSNGEVIWYHFTAVKWYHITSRVLFLVMALSHWYPHIICNKEKYQMVKACFRILNSCNLVGKRIFDLKIIKIREIHQKSPQFVFRDILPPGLYFLFSWRTIIIITTWRTIPVALALSF